MHLKTSDFKQLMRLYDQKQLKNQSLLNERRNNVYDKIPEIRAIDREISRTSIQLSKLIITQEEDASSLIQNIREKNLELSMKKIELLHMHGFPKDYLQISYECPKCKDTGFIHQKKCSCLKQAMIDYAYEQSNLKTLLESENFSTFSLDYFSDDVDPEYGLSPKQNMTEIYKRCLQFTSDFGHSFVNMLLFGKVGVGKSFLSNCIAKELLDHGYTVIYLTAFQLFEIFEKNKFNKSNEEDYEDLVVDILSCDLLIIDDLGTEFSNSFTSTQLFNCLNTRMLAKKSTLISTNLPPDSWSKQYDDRIVSRILGNYETLEIFGEDIRIKKAFH